MKKLSLNLNLTSVIVIIAVGVLFPVMLVTAVGIVATVIAANTGGIITGVLVISFAMAAVGNGLLALIFVGRKARLARQQADFIANVSHEFRTPLSAIRLYTQTLQSGQLANDPDRTAECLATILRETTWLDVMLDRVLTWRASSRDVLPIVKQTVPVSETVITAVERFKTMFPPGEVELNTEIKSTLSIPHDPKALNAVVLNLLINAYKYTGKKKEIALSVWDEETEMLITVRDNGTGLTPLEAKRIFEPFYRIAGESAGDPGGIGLGLTIAKHMVQLHGGTIDVESEKGRGSTFIIRLPVSFEETKK